MLTKLLTSLALTFSLSAFAEPLGVPPGKFSAPVVAEKCKQGCFVLDQADYEALIAQVQALRQQAFQAGVEAGVKKEKSTI